MPSIKLSRISLSAILLLALTGCSDKNSKSVFNEKHPSGWATAHKEAGKKDTETCFECHGENLDGGIAKVSCTQCHPAGPTSKHPVTWAGYAYARHASTFNAEKTAPSCATALCHGTQLDGAAGSSGPSCTTCHGKSGSTYARHPETWTSIKEHGAYLKKSTTDATQKASCSNSVCHGTDLKGVFLSGPSCVACHSGKDSTTGAFVKHPSDWTSLNSHKVVTDYSSCKTGACHGTTLTGGAYGAPSCYKCHIKYSADETVIKKHPMTWDPKPLYANHVTYKRSHTTTSCLTSVGCHQAGERNANTDCVSCHVGQ